MFSDPQKILEQFKIGTGKTVADLGSGAGFFALPAAKMVGQSGRVYAVDVLKDMLQKVKNDGIRQGIGNVEGIWGNIEKLGGTRLADAAVDVVLLCNSLFQQEDKNSCVLEIKRILKTGGEVLVVDWQESFGGMGPQPEAVVAKDVARALFEKAGFVFEREIQAGTHQYGIIFRRV